MFRLGRSEGAIVEFDNLAGGWLASGRVGGRWRFGCSYGTMETGRER
jgi:hypothetical protein